MSCFSVLLSGTRKRKEKEKVFLTSKLLEPKKTEGRRRMDQIG